MPPLPSFDQAAHRKAVDPAGLGVVGSGPFERPGKAPRPLPLVIALPIIAGLSLALWAGVGRLLAMVAGGS